MTRIIKRSVKITLGLTLVLGSIYPNVNAQNSNKSAFDTYTESSIEEIRDTFERDVLAAYEMLKKAMNEKINTPMSINGEEFVKQDDKKDPYYSSELSGEKITKKALQEAKNPAFIRLKENIWEGLRKGDGNLIKNSINAIRTKFKSISEVRKLDLEFYYAWGELINQEYSKSFKRVDKAIKYLEKLFNKSPITFEDIKSNSPEEYLRSNVLTLGGLYEIRSYALMRSRDIKDVGKLVAKDLLIAEEIRGPYAKDVILHQSAYHILIGVYIQNDLPNKVEKVAYYWERFMSHPYHYDLLPEEKENICNFLSSNNKACGLCK